MGQIHNRPSLKPLRRALRSALTSAEAVLWKNLQRSQLEGKKFRRQHSVGPFVLDFYCPECRVAVELDGAGHFESVHSRYEACRTDYLNRLGIRVVRFENRMVFEALESVLETIRQSLQWQQENRGPQ
ncbi:MAG: endonuclease domain-containing protein [Acidobacteriota bacterium]